MTKIRIQKYLSQCGVASRRAAEGLLLEGRIKVNGRVITALGTTIDPNKDIVKVGQKVIQVAHRGVVLLNKPRGVVSTLSDPEGRPTVAHYMTKHYSSYFPVGRLDFDSSGLVIMTNDGDMAAQLMHPRYGFQRVYEVRVKGIVSDAVLEKMELGVRLEDGIVRADVFFVSSDEDSSLLKVTVTEGRNRVVRRMMDKVGHRVKKLKRISYGPFKLGRLEPGQIRKLTEAEYLAVKGKVSRESAAAVAKKKSS